MILMHVVPAVTLFHGQKCTWNWNLYKPGSRRYLFPLWLPHPPLPPCSRVVELRSFSFLILYLIFQGVFQGFPPGSLLFLPWQTYGLTCGDYCCLGAPHSSSEVAKVSESDQATPQALNPMSIDYSSHPIIISLHLINYQATGLGLQVLTEITEVI